MISRNEPSVTQCFSELSLFTSLVNSLRANEESKTKKHRYGHSATQEPIRELSGITSSYAYPIAFDGICFEEWNHIQANGHKSPMSALLAMTKARNVCCSANSAPKLSAWASLLPFGIISVRLNRSLQRRIRHDSWQVLSNDVHCEITTSQWSKNDFTWKLQVCANIYVHS